MINVQKHGKVKIMAECDKCGKVIPDGEDFCDSCWESLPDADDTEAVLEDCKTWHYKGVKHN